MSLSAIAATVAAVAPELGRMLKGPLALSALRVLADKLGVSDDVHDVLKALGQPGQDAKVREAELAFESMVVAAQARNTAQINQTIRMEEATRQVLAKYGRFPSGWRPLFGYAVTLAFFATMVTPLVLIWKSPQDISAFVALLQASAVMWTMAFSVLGVTVYKRSQEKLADAALDISDIRALTEKVKQDVTKVRDRS